MKKMYTATTTVKSFLCMLLACAFTVTAISAATACTALLVKDVNGNAYKGRTMEFSMQIPTLLTTYPVGTHIESVTPGGEKGLSFETRYTIVGMTLDAVPGAKQPVIVDGANDQGLTISGNAQNGNKSPPVGTDNKKILSGADFGSWVLGNFRTVEEVKTAVAQINIWLPNCPMMGNVPLPLHYAVFDKSGAGIVIEFVDGKMTVYDNPVGVMTNGPEFPWHLTNLINYTQSNVDRNTAHLGTLKLETPDSGIALTSLPSSETCVGRFVKAAFYANYVRKASKPDDAVKTLSHIMNNFDRPQDLTVDTGAGAGDGPRTTKGLSSEVTEWTVMNDLSRNLYYVRTINSLNWSVIDLNKLQGLKKVKSLSTYDVDSLGSDATAFFLK